MENQKNLYKTPPKFLDHLPRDIREEVNKKNQMPLSPLCVLPNHSTPPSRLFKVKNPFEAHLNEQLHKHVFSPSVFAEVKKPGNNEKFKWTIEDVSILRPANIDVNAVVNLEQPNPDEEARVQAKIDKYFNETHIVESPWNANQNQKCLIPETESPYTDNFEEPKKVSSVATQTVLRLSPNLPENVEKVLLPYYTYTEDQRRQTLDLNSSLCRRLFNCEPHYESPGSSIESLNHSEMSIIGSPFIQKDTIKHKRNYDSSSEHIDNIIPHELSPINNLTPLKLDDCQLSPINANDNERNHLDDDSLPLIQSHEVSGIRNANFSGHMSVDSSFNINLENEAMEGSNFYDIESPVRSNEFMESLCNWDLEYNNVSLNTSLTRHNLFESEQNISKMDFLNVPTPKSKIFSGQRKNLRDTFEAINDEEELILDEGTEITNTEEKFMFDEKERQTKYRKICDSIKMTEDNFNFTHDTGYSTSVECSQKLGLSKEDTAMSVSGNSFNDVEDRDNFNIFASTPTKNY